MALEGPDGMTYEVVDDSVVTEDGTPSDFGGEDFFATVLAPLAPCCREALERATDHIAVLAAGLFAKAEATLDEARLAADRNPAVALTLVRVATEYRYLAVESA